MQRLLNCRAHGCLVASVPAAGYIRGSNRFQQCFLSAVSDGFRQFAHVAVQVNVFHRETDSTAYPVDALSLASPDRAEHRTLNSRCGTTSNLSRNPTHRDLRGNPCTISRSMAEKLLMVFRNGTADSDSMDSAYHQPVSASRVEVSDCLSFSRRYARGLFRQASNSQFAGASAVITIRGN